MDNALSRDDVFIGGEQLNRLGLVIRLVNVLRQGHPDVRPAHLGDIDRLHLVNGPRQAVV